MDQLTVTDIAALLGIKPATWRAYVSRGQAPPPDGHLGRTPWWRRLTIAAWWHYYSRPSLHPTTTRLTEGKELLDRAAQWWLGMTAEEFIAAWDAGRLEDTLGVQEVAALLPFARSSGKVGESNVDLGLLAQDTPN